MSARLQLPGAQGSNWMRNASLRSGVLTGIYLSCALVVWLVVANRVPEFEAFAGVRNLAGAVVMILLMAIPVLRFRFVPMRLFVAGLVAWTLLTVTYRAAEMFFSLLESRLGALAWGGVVWLRCCIRVGCRDLHGSAQSPRCANS